MFGDCVLNHGNKSFTFCHDRNLIVHLPLYLPYLSISFDKYAISQLTGSSDISAISHVVIF
ncbi:MAG: hypothetical protein Q8S84_07420 [bacterium]|nr:hypothetical protein [bacterium]